MNDLQNLINIERDVAKGIQALKRRDQLLVDLLGSGVRQADMTRAINQARAEVGVPPVTPDAIGAAIKRRLAR
jgi:hypothetical protein